MHTNVKIEFDLEKWLTKCGVSADGAKEQITKNMESSLNKLKEIWNTTLFITTTDSEIEKIIKNHFGE